MYCLQYPAFQYPESHRKESLKQLIVMPRYFIWKIFLEILKRFSFLFFSTVMRFCFCRGLREHKLGHFACDQATPIFFAVVTFIISLDLVLISIHKCPAFSGFDVFSGYNLLGTFDCSFYESFGLLIFFYFLFFFSYYRTDIKRLLLRWPFWLFSF